MLNCMVDHHLVPAYHLLKAFALRRQVILRQSWDTLHVSGLKDPWEHERKVGYFILQSGSPPIKEKSRFLNGWLDLKQITFFAVLWVKEVLCPVY